MRNYDLEFLKHFSMVIGFLMLVTAGLIVGAYFLHDSLPPEVNPKAAQITEARIAPAGAVYAGETGAAAQAAGVDVRPFVQPAGAPDIRRYRVAVAPVSLPPVSQPWSPAAGARISPRPVILRGCSAPPCCWWARATKRCWPSTGAPPRTCPGPPT